jgi:hypothetical protein
MPFTQNGDVVEWNFATLGKFEAQSVTMVVEVLDSAVDPITHDQFGATSDEVPTATYYGGPLVVTVLPPPPDYTNFAFLPFLRQD